MLVPSPRHRPADLAAWDDQSRLDPVRYLDDSLQRRVETGLERIVRWSAGRAGYVGVSWGKDSVVLADLCQVAAPDWPLVSVTHRLSNPDNGRVRDMFLACWPEARYREIEVPLRRNDVGGWSLTGSLEKGFAEAARTYGGCYMSGVRADESAKRRLWARRSGGETERVLSPLIWWSAQDVFAYLCGNELPIHPVYAMNDEGRWSRDRLRVSDVTLRRGVGMGRRVWEHLYYPEFAEDS